MDSGLEVIEVEVVTDVATRAPDDWLDLVEAWAESQDSPETRRAYRTDGRQWTEFCVRAGGHPKAARSTLLVDWRRELEALGREKKTIARKMAAVSSLYSWLEAEEEIERSPMGRVKRPKVGDAYSATIALDTEESTAILAQAKAEGPAAWAAVAILLNMALRSRELLSVNIEDCKKDQGIPTLTVTRKGGEKARLPIPPKARTPLAAAIRGRTSGPIITNTYDQRADYRWLYNLTRVLGERAGVGADDPHGKKRIVTPHTLRATYATSALDHGANLADVQDAMGHKDPRTTRLYDRGRGRYERLLRAAEKATSHLPDDHPEETT